MSILEPLTIAGRRLPSRVVFGSIVTNLGDGRAFSPRHVAFYRERAAGGSGLIVTEDASVHEGDHPYERCPLATEAGPGWAAIGEACAEHGSPVVAGLSHAGGQSTSAFSQRELWAPSDEPDVNTREVPKIMEQADIDEVVAGFGTAAAGAVEAGLAGVEVNGGQFSLVRQFLSGLTNQRGDEYGQDPSLFARRVLEAVRAGVGPDRIVGLRLSCDELAPWAGITPESAAELAATLAPMVDYLTVVRGSIFSAAETRPTAHHQPGFNLELAGRIREAVGRSIPIVAQGSIVSVEQADGALADGHCDAVEMTRAQLADPELVARARAGRQARPCVLCNQLCSVRDNRNPIISCIANPRAGHETVDQPEPPGRSEPSPAAARPGSTAGSPARSTADVLIVGAGPAGLEAARVAGRRGLRVELVDAAGAIGGTARIAAEAPAHRRLLDLVSWLAADAESHGATIRLDHRVDSEELNRFAGPVIVATGGEPGPRTYDVEPGFPVIDGVDVLDGSSSELDDRDGLRVAIWDPIGGPIAVALAELLASRGLTVSLVTPDGIAGTMLALTGDLAGANVRLQQAGVTIVRRQRLKTVRSSRLELVHVFTGEATTLATDVVIDVAGRRPGSGPDRTDGRPVIRVGDAVAPRTVAEAIREGRAAAMDLPLPEPVDRATEAGT